MRKIVAISLAAVFATGLVGYSLAGPDRVAFPSGYAERFVLYNTVDRPDRKTIRFMYVSPETHPKAKAGEPAPDGTILIMEDHRAKLDASGSVEFGPDGRLVPTDQITNIFVMEKRTGWGDAYPPEVRNGDWDYAHYLPGGAPKADATFDGCFSCHRNRSGRDFNFTYTKYLMDREGK
ncbi:cytochrome P460 family protein [Sinorhizobium sp. 8-89]|uniref:cytochrome P460 family protein n=1 Tax=Sinorhizobium sp. 7-81 TaxID=3049087 RepID=UPI0024C3E1BE|nr:cytochrome P460 family protein [Sinorhizobium sp. 7-81]MDK1388831.1 cytochrome P460 family protein [Sinorhizobium sp. 7-81]